jgi:hypothetical protein
MVGYIVREKSPNVPMKNQSSTLLTASRRPDPPIRVLVMQVHVLSSYTRHESWGLTIFPAGWKDVKRR